MKKHAKLYLTITYLFIFIYTFIKIVDWNKDSYQTKQLITEIKTFIDKKDESFIDFNNLKDNNTDTVAWLEVIGTNIDYPVVQTIDNNYYLSHSYDKKTNEAGWVYMDYRNNINEMDRNTIIYAHNRKDNTMFGTLKKTLKKSWQNNKKNQIIKLYLENKTLYFQVFSTYTIQTEDYYLTTTFSKSEFKKFIKTIKKRSNHNFKVDVSVNDYILTLSTCNTRTTKTVLHAKLINTIYY